ncbi:hypothetical protein [uncultured Parabacteroides sp.]|uniref:hypothetical protein n=1 Tax=uncultured Parabacteroides sp. TaxID=512312 RepID=UPI00262CC469|nr:hypothetical protein [uncultured Parabacteroides sp.]
MVERSRMMHKTRKIIGIVCFFAFAVNTMAQGNWEDSVKIYIEKARWGEVLAYEKLAGYYHDGLGVEHNFVNMLMMYFLANEKGGLSMEEYMHRYEEDDPDRLLFDAMNDLDHKRKEDALQKQEKLRAMNLPSHITLQAVLVANQDREKYRQLLREASEKGCMLGQLLYAMSVEKRKDKEKYEKIIKDIMEDIPMAYNLLGKFYWDQAEETDDKALMESAKECFEKADEQACLTKRNARRLLHYYDNRQGKGETECDPVKLKRLRIVACMDVEAGY